MDQSNRDLASDSETAIQSKPESGPPSIQESHFDEDTLRSWATADVQIKSGQTSINHRAYCKEHVGHRYIYELWPVDFINKTKEETLPGVMVMFHAGDTYESVSRRVGSLDREIEDFSDIPRTCPDNDGRSVEEQVKAGERSLTFASHPTSVYRYNQRELKEKEEF
jgi:hypothetical protein